MSPLQDQEDCRMMIDTSHRVGIKVAGEMAVAQVQSQAPSSVNRAATRTWMKFTSTKRGLGLRVLSNFQ